MDRQSTSWQRADPEAALIETADTAQWTVALPDGNDVHTVTMFTDGINTRGHCTCDGYHYHDRCAHLITIRQAELLDILTLDVEIVRIPTLADEAVDAVERKVATYDEIEADAEPEAVRSDGGRRSTRSRELADDDKTDLRFRLCCGSTRSRELADDDETDLRFRLCCGSTRSRELADVRRPHRGRRLPMTLGGYSWRGGTREYPHRQDDDRDQSEEPPAEYWEQRARQQETDEYTAGSDDETFGRPEGRL